MFLVFSLSLSRWYHCQVKAWNRDGFFKYVFVRALSFLSSQRVSHKSRLVESTSYTEACKVEATLREALPVAAHLTCAFLARVAWTVWSGLSNYLNSIWHWNLVEWNFQIAKAAIGVGGCWPPLLHFRRSVFLIYSNIFFTLQVASQCKLHK